MIALAECIRDHWHSVERDLLALNKTADDIGTPNLTLCQLISVVIAAPPGTAVHHSAGKWTKAEELLANLSEQQAGVFGINARYARPGVDTAPVKPWSEFDSLAPYKGIVLEALPSDEFTVKLKQRQRERREQAEGKQ